MDKKLTDNEIVKALECCVDGSGTGLIKATLDLINRLQEENERLQQYHDDMESAIYSFREDHAKVKFFKNEIKAEAYKECIEKVKEEILFYSNMTEVYEFLDSLLKELVGDSGETVL